MPRTGKASSITGSPSAESMYQRRPACYEWASGRPMADQSVQSGAVERPQAGRNAQFDGLDARLVALLAEQPRTGVLECSRRLGVARGTVQARLDRLQARGVITGFGPDVH